MPACPVLPSFKGPCDIGVEGCYGVEELRLAHAISEALVNNPPAFAIAPGTAVIIEDSGGDELEINVDGSLNVVVAGASGTLTSLTPTLVAAGTTTTAFSVDGVSEFTIQVDVTVTSGTINLDLEASIDGVTYYVLASQSLSTSDTIGFSTIRSHQFVRLNWTSGGTGSVLGQIWTT